MQPIRWCGVTARAAAKRRTRPSSNSPRRPSSARVRHGSSRANTLSDSCCCGHKVKLPMPRSPLTTPQHGSPRDASGSPPRPRSRPPPKIPAARPRPQRNASAVSAAVSTNCNSGSPTSSATAWRAPTSTPTADSTASPHGWSMPRPRGWRPRSERYPSCSRDPRAASTGRHAYWKSSAACGR